MESLYLLIPIAIIFVCIAVAVFIWAVKTDQFDDLDRQGHDILFEDNDKPAAKPNLKKEKH
ncbi:MAG: cbb3-type cytochrome oxidase assembly protein CcoS [Vibrio sp.]